MAQHSSPRWKQWEMSQISPSTYLFVKKSSLHSIQIKFLNFKPFLVWCFFPYCLMFIQVLYFCCWFCCCNLRHIFDFFFFVLLILGASALQIYTYIKFSVMKCLLTLFCFFPYINSSYISVLPLHSNLNYEIMSFLKANIHYSTVKFFPLHIWA